MITVDFSNGAPNLEKILELATEDNILLKTMDGREFLLAELEDFEDEIKLTRRNQELMEFLNNRSKDTKTYSIDEVREQLGLE